MSRYLATIGDLVKRVRLFCPGDDGWYEVYTGEYSDIGIVIDVEMPELIDIDYFDTEEYFIKIIWQDPEQGVPWCWSNEIALQSAGKIKIK